MKSSTKLLKTNIQRDWGKNNRIISKQTFKHYEELLAYNWFCFCEAAAISYLHARINS